MSAEEIIETQRLAIERQREAITRLLGAVDSRTVAERGAVIKFKLDDPLQFVRASRVDPVTRLSADFRIKQSYVDSDGAVIVELEPMG